uniref:RNA-directed DNA polymerase n=2 Tax=Lutzomyia longipalpis TaxID=7200 RepID=A0A1B0GHP0_LUTLO
MCERVQSTDSVTLEVNSVVNSLPSTLPKVLESVVDRMDPEMTQEEREMAYEVMLTHQMAFSVAPEDLGRTNAAVHHIDVGEHTPIKQPPRRVPMAKQREATELIAKMERQGVIEKSTSPWCSPVVLVRKKDGTLRFCVDYRRLNEITKKDAHPLPRIDTTLESLSGATWFHTLDLFSGYWQVPVAPQDKEKTAFSAGTGLWQFRVLPFGLCNSPATFERLMENTLQELIPERCLIYLDDILIPAKSFSQSVENLKLVLARLQQAGLKLNPKKCSLFQRKAHFLGHIVSAEGVSTDPDKIRAVAEWPIPRNKKEVQSFLGICAYYRSYIQGHSHIAKPLNSLTEKATQFHWTEECQRAFERLKECLIAAPILAHPQQSGEFILDCDCSGFAIGCVLSQVQDSRERVIGYYSKSLSRSERNYCATRRELLAVVRGVHHFHHFLFGQHFRLRTDHASLRWLTSFRNPEGQVARWIERLSQYNYTLEYRAGRLHSNADALSRRPCLEENCQYCGRLEERERGHPITDRGEETKLARLTQIASRWDWKAVQSSAPELMKVRGWVESNCLPDRDEIIGESDWTKHLWAKLGSLEISDSGILYFRRQEQNESSRPLVVVPRAIVPEILCEVHDAPAGGHLGIKRTLKRVRERFYWPFHTRDVRDFVATCQKCGEKKGPQRKTRGQLSPTAIGCPFERIAVDITGPFPITTRGNRYILVAMDYFSKWPEILPIPDQTAETVARALVEQVFSRYGVPQLIHSDQGRNFEADLFRQVMALMGSEKTRTTPLHPQSDGMVERFNRTLLNYLAKFVEEDQDRWDEFLPMAGLAYRTATHEATGESPATVLFGRNLTLPVDLLVGESPTETTDSGADSPSTYVAKLRQQLWKIHWRAREQLQHSAEDAKRRYDLRRNVREFVVDDLVWLHAPRRRIGRCPKLERPWSGPWQVCKKISNLIYRIKWPGSRRRSQVVHVDRLAPFRTRATACSAP